MQLINSFVRYALLFLLVMLISWGCAFLWLNRSTVNELFVEASQARFDVMSGVAGPSTYLVFHNDFSALETLARERDDIIGVEPWKSAGIAAMAFTSREAEAIELVRSLKTVNNLVYKNVPMICH